MHTHTHTHTHPFQAQGRVMSGAIRVSQYQKGKPSWILLKHETVNGSGTRWAIWKSAPHSRQITTAATHHSVFTVYRLDALPDAQTTASKQRRHHKLYYLLTNLHRETLNSKALPRPLRSFFMSITSGAVGPELSLPSPSPSFQPIFCSSSRPRCTADRVV